MFGHITTSVLWDYLTTSYIHATSNYSYMHKPFRLIWGSHRVIISSLLTCQTPTHYKLRLSNWFFRINDLDFPIFRTVINLPCRIMCFIPHFGLLTRLWCSRIPTSPSDNTLRYCPRLNFLICTSAHRWGLSPQWTFTFRTLDSFYCCNVIAVPIR